MNKKRKNSPAKSVLEFISEAGLLKRISRSGWQLLGIKDSESVADHSFRCAVIGYVLARVEGVPPHKVLLMSLFNDIQEARITDLHKMAQRYIEIETTEDGAFREQVESLPPDIKKELSDMRREYKGQKSAESIIARDADILECLIQAKEYHQHGYLEAAKFMKNAPGFLKTKSARELWALAKNSDLNKWWVSLGEFKR